MRRYLAMQYAKIIDVEAVPDLIDEETGEVTEVGQKEQYHWELKNAYVEIHEAQVRANREARRRDIDYYDIEVPAARGGLDGKLRFIPLPPVEEEQNETGSGDPGVDPPPMAA